MVITSRSKKASRGPRLLTTLGSANAAQCALVVLLNLTAYRGGCFQV